jgi:exodeoxyribonuclease VII small subunit
MELKDFEGALKRLEKIVSKLEAGELSLEDSVKLFEEGMEISSFCGKKLDDAERRVEILLKRADGELSEEAFEPAGQGQAQEGE